MGTASFLVLYHIRMTLPVPELIREGILQISCHTMQI